MPGNAAATAANILAHQSLFRLGLAADLAAMAGEVILALLFYELFWPVSRSLALLVAFFRIMWAAIYAANSLTHLAPLYFLGGASYLSGFTTGQLQALALLSLRMHAAGFNIGLIYFRIDCVLIGWLIVRSDFLPWLLGVLMGLAGVCYLVNSFANILLPPGDNILYPYILFPCLPGEFGLMLWLLFFAVNADRWKAQAAKV